LLDGSQITGRIKQAGESAATIDESVINYLDIKRANLEIEFKQVGK
jgi:hypothetical protein